MTNRDLEINNVLSDVYIERIEQDNKWGEQNHSPVKWLAILAEEFGEASKEIVNYNFSKKASDDIRKEYLIRMRKELVQVAAVAVAFIESIDRNNLKNNEK